jgi:iron complex outermembrane receptor protein
MKGFLTTAGFAALAIASSAAAQTAPPAAQAPGDAAAPTGVPTQAAEQGAVGTIPTPDADGIGDIIVTAQRRSESLQRTALAISAVDGAAIRNAGVSQPQDLTKLIPALQLSPLGAGGTQVTIRGVGNFAPFIYSEPAVAINLDGVYLARSAAPNGLFFDLERVEVLKGPQGTLYGRNATGGAINVIVARPQLGTLAGNVDMEVGTYDLVRASGMINLPIGDEVALRVAAQVVHRDGYLSDGYLDDIGQAVRAQLLFEPSDALSINLSADYIHQGGKGPGAVFSTANGFLDNDDPYRGPTSPESNALLRNASLGISGGRNPTLLPPIERDGFTDLDAWGVNATINYDAGFANLTVIPAYRFTRNDFKAYAGGFPLTSTERSEQTSVEVRLASPADSAVKWVVGGYFFDDDSTLFVDANQGITRTITTSPGLPVRSLAVFGQLTVPLTERFRATGGLRYTNEKKSQTGVNITRLPALPAGFPGPPAAFYALTCPTPGTFNIPAGTCTGPFSGDLEFNKLTYKAGVEFDAGDASLLYASVETGFKAGGFYPSLPQNTFAPETIQAFTLGSKNRFLDNTLQLNLEAFYWKYNDKQITHLGPIRPAGFSIITENAGKAKIYGAEADLLWRPTRNDRLSVNLQYVFSEFQELVYNVSLPGAPGSRAAVSCPQTPGVDPVSGQRFATVNCAGFPLAQTPKWVLNASYQRTFDLGGDRGGIDAILGTRLQSEYFVAEEYLPGEFQPDTMVSYASLTYRTGDGRLSVGAYIENIEDEAVRASGFVQPAIGQAIVILRPPRTYGIRTGFRF